MRIEALPAWLGTYGHPAHLLRDEWRRRLLALWTPHFGFGGPVLRDLSGRKRNRAFSGPTPKITGLGRALNFDGSNDCVVGDSGPWGIASGYTLMFFGRASDTGEGHLITCDSGSSGTKRMWQFRLENDRQVRFIRFNAAGSILANFATTPHYNDSEWHVYAATFTISVGSIIYVDGNLVSLDTNKTANADNGNEPLTIGAASYSHVSFPLGPLAGDMLAGLFFNRCLSAAEIELLSRSLWSSMFRNPSRITLKSVAAATTAISLAWTDNSEHEDGYSIERDTDGGGFVEIDTVAADAESYNDTGVATGHTYTYRVKATSTALGDSEYSNEAEVTV